MAVADNIGKTVDTLMGVGPGMVNIQRMGTLGLELEVLASALVASPSLVASALVASPSLVASALLE
jgi:hypothetical protein